MRFVGLLLLLFPSILFAADEALFEELLAVGFAENNIETEQEKYEFTCALRHVFLALDSSEVVAIRDLLAEIQAAEVSDESVVDAADSLELLIQDKAEQLKSHVEQCFSSE